MELTEQQKKCMECRECCECVDYPVTMLSKEVMKYFYFRGDKFYFNNAGVMLVTVNKPCQNLGPEGCKIYDTRPPTCSSYMCSVGDKSVWEVKEQQCQKAMDQVRRAIELDEKQGILGPEIPQ